MQPHVGAQAARFVDELRALAPDVCVVVAYGKILPPEVLAAPKHGCLNVHASLLPKYRGAAPIQWAIIRGERETGVTLMQMDVGMDTGDMLRQAHARHRRVGDRRAAAHAAGAARRRAARRGARRSSRRAR